MSLVTVELIRETHHASALRVEAGEADNYPSLPVIVAEGEAEAEPPAPAPVPAELPIADVIKSLVHFLANRPTHMPLWQYEDITAKGDFTCLLYSTHE